MVEGELTKDQLLKKLLEVKRSYNSLKFAYEELKQIHNLSADGIRTIDKNFNVITVNSTFINLSGIGENESLGRKCYEVFSSPLCHTLECPLRRILGGEKEVRIDVEKSRLDGTAVPCIITAKPYYDNEGNFVGIVEEFKDITDRIEAEKQLKIINKHLREEISKRKMVEWSLWESQKRYEALLKAMPVGVFQATAEGHFIYANEMTGQILGVSQEVLFNMGWMKLLHPEDRAPVLTEWARCQMKAEIFKMDYRFLRHDSSIVWVTCQAAPILGLDNKVSWYVGTLTDITEKKIAEEQLIQNKLRLKSYIEQCPEGIFVFDGTGKISEVNAAGCSLLGYSKEELLGISAGDLKHSDYLSGLNQLTAKAEIKTEGNYFRKDGSYVVVDISATSIGDNCYLAFVRDITERKQYEEALRQSESHYSLILNGISELFALYEVQNNTDFRFLKVNRSFLETIGLAEEQVVGKSVEEVLPEEAPVVKQNYLTAIKTQRTVRLQEKVRYGLFETRITPIFNSHGECTNLIFTARNMTGEKRAEEKMLFQASMLDQVRNAVVATDVMGNIIYFNKFAEKLYELRAEEIRGQNIHKLATLDNCPCKTEAIRDSVLKNGYWEGEFNFSKLNGEEVVVHSVLTLTRNAQGEPVSIVGVSSDITEKKKLEQELARMDRLNLVGEMAAGIGHEVRNPLTAVRGFLQLLSAKKENAEQQEIFQLMIDELDRANSIISEYLSLAKNKKINLKLQNINTVLRHIMPLLQANAAVSDKFIRVNFGQVPDMLLDGREISQLVINLVRNGLEAMSPGGNLTVSTFMDSQDVVLMICDEGNGIAQEILEKIGTPFVTSKDHGTGLGLAICYSIAARHNAKINVETDTSGTTFYVRFQNVNVFN